MRRSPSHVRACPHLHSSEKLAPSFHCGVSAKPVCPKPFTPSPHFYFNLTRPSSRSPGRPTRTSVVCLSSSPQFALVYLAAFRAVRYEPHASPPFISALSGPSAPSSKKAAPPCLLITPAEHSLSLAVHLSRLSPHTFTRAPSSCPFLIRSTSAVCSPYLELTFPSRFS